MNEATALVLAYQAFQKAREAADRLKDADLKMAMAEGLNALADARIEVADLKSENEQLRGRVRELETGPRCPRCHTGSWRLVESKPHPRFGSVGGKVLRYQCSDCEFEDNETKLPGQ